MAEEINFDGQTADLDVFDCPKCGQTIDTSASVCRFCGAKIDHAAAENSAHLLARVDVALSDASYLRNTVVIVLILVGGVVFSLLRQPRFFVLFGFENTVLGFCVLMLLVCSPFPLWTLRWWTKYAKITSEDDDFQNARKVIQSIGKGTTAAFVTFGALLCLLLVYRFAHS
jgi:hypothetical protein